MTLHDAVCRRNEFFLNKRNVSETSLIIDFALQPFIIKRMVRSVKPVLYASKCLGFAPCRYNGVTIHDDFVEKMKHHVIFTTACPELEIGLGVPRAPVRIIVSKNAQRLFQPASGLDMTEKMIEHSHIILDGVDEVDGFILKSRSPSCGIKDTRYFLNAGKGAPVGRGPGIFGRIVMKRFPFKPIEDEGRILDPRIREHFLTSVFTRAHFRTISRQARMKDVIHFHAENKLLLMSYSQKQSRILGRIVANVEKEDVGSVVRRYEEALSLALTSLPRSSSNINVLMHAFGYCSEQLSKHEKTHFIDSLERYRFNKIPLSVPLGILRSWIIRFDIQYLKQQSFFQPYPEGLIEITDTGKGRKIRP